MTSIEEFELLFRYLKGNLLDDNCHKSYKQGVLTLQLSLSPKEIKQLEWCLKHPFWVGIVDFGLALNAPTGNLRKRFALAAAIIECQPNGVNLYLNKKHLSYPLFKTITWGIKAVFQMFLAQSLFYLKRWK